MKSDRPLRIAQVGFGLLPIPPQGYGAVESIIWEYTTRLRAMGHEVHIVNERKRKAARELLKLGPLDFIHCHNDRAVSRVMWAGLLKRAKVISTSHHAWDWGNLSKDSRRLLRMCSYARYQMVLTDTLGAEIRRKNPAAKIALQPNGTEVDEFRFDPHPGNGKAICVGRIEERKRQDWVERALKGSGLVCDFVGPVKDPLLSSEASHLGEWDRSTLRDRLTDYSCLILVSRSEGQPLVVAEALAAGLSVVVSPAGAINLPALPFVHRVQKEDEIASATRQAIEGNPSHRTAARAYAKDFMDWDALVNQYVKQLRAWL